LHPSSIPRYPGFKGSALPFFKTFLPLVESEASDRNFYNFPKISCFLRVVHPVGEGLFLWLNGSFSKIEDWFETPSFPKLFRILFFTPFCDVWLLTTLDTRLVFFPDDDFYGLFVINLPTLRHPSTPTPAITKIRRVANCVFFGVSYLPVVIDAALFSVRWFLSPSTDFEKPVFPPRLPLVPRFAFFFFSSTWQMALTFHPQIPSCVHFFYTLVDV